MPTVTAVNQENNSRFTVTFAATGQTVLTDPPAGHGGDGTSFAPTDLVDAALLSCTGATIIAKAKSLGLDAKGIRLTSSHEMADAPRRIASLDVAVQMPFSAEERQKKSLMAAAKGCTVRNSLRADIRIKLKFTWADGSIDTVEE
jgi:uncharacterized OsmC-like protein